MKDYRMDFAHRVLTVSKNFAQKAITCPNSRESQIINQCRSLCPDLKIAYYHKSSNSKQYGGMTYTKMENYIRLYENSNELLSMFSLVKEVAKIQKNKLSFVYKWFVTQFPNYDELPEIRNGKLYMPVVKIPEPEEAMLQVA